MKITAFLFFLFIQNVYALVDYTDSSSDQKSLNRISSQVKNSDQQRSLIWKSDFSFTTNYEVSEIESQKYGFINLNTHLQTPFNIYFDASYWSASSKGGSTQKGNPKIILGFNWLRFGSPAEEARFDFFGGVKIAGDSSLASSRTDKIFGVETSKRFGSFGLGIGYDVTVAGQPKYETDMSIGNISKITLSAGWMVSNDIQFELEAENFKVSKSSLDRSSKLEKDISFSCLSPKLNLTLAPAVNLELGARFRTNKAKSEQNLKLAKLYDLHGAYTNSLFAGLNLSI